MQIVGEHLMLSSGDLVGHLNCRFLTELDLKVAKGQLEKPKIWDPFLEALAERGAQHERGFVEHLKSLGQSVTIIEGVGVDSPAVDSTMKAMERGDPVVVQGALRTSRWNGRVDVLLRVERPSRFDLTPQIGAARTNIQQNSRRFE